MSMLFKGVRKIYKKVRKAVKKLLPIILAVAAIYFTGGAALGWMQAGGWQAAAAKVGTTLGGKGLLGKVLTGAIQQAGTGALIGGATAAVTGGDIGEGLKKGAMVGAVTGGLLSGIDYVGNASALEGSAPIPGGSVTTTPLPKQAGVNYGAGTGQAIDAAGNVIPAATQAASGGRGLLSGVFGKGGWIERNPEIAGGIISGIGQGLLSPEEDYLRERQRLISANYAGTDPGRNFRDLAPGTSGQSPTERFDPRTYGSWEYVYDPKQGRIVRTPVTQ